MVGQKTFLKGCSICEYLGDVDYVAGHFRVRKNPFLKGYFYIEAVSHVESWIGNSGDFFLDYSKCLEFCYQEIQTFSIPPLKIYQVSIAEKVPHLHVHIIPRYQEECKGLAYIELALNNNLPEIMLPKF